MSDELHHLPIAEAARRIAARELSPVELTEACLARIDALDGKVHAFIELTADLALQQARSAEAEIMRLGPRSPLHGMPFGLKDIYDTRGIRTTGHSALHRDRIPERDCACAGKFYAAGAVLLGKLATHEFATGGPAYDLPWPPANNPWLLDRFPGGSSSGSAAAVAAGFVPGAMGSDTAGSIRLPAAFCGVVGLKPTYGRVSKRGVLPLSWTLDTCGPLARTVEDAAIMLQAIAGHDALDPSTALRPVPDYRARLDGDIRGLRIGVVRHFYQSDARADDTTISAMDQAVATLEELGASVVDVTLPTLADYQAASRVIIVCEAFAIHRRNLLARPDLYAAVTRYRVMPGALVMASEYSNALRFQRALATHTAQALNGVDALVTATTYGPAPVQAQMRAEANFSTPPLTNPFNAAQLPALSVCNGFSAEGLPLGMQIAGRAFDEETVLRIGHAYQRASAWRARRPAFTEGQDALDPVMPGADPQAVPADLMAHYRARASAAGLEPDEQALADLCQAMPHLEKMIARIPDDHGYDDSPSTVYSW